MDRTLTLCAALIGMITLSAGLAPAADDGHAHAERPQHQAGGAERIGDPYPLMVDPLGDSLVEVDKPVEFVLAGRDLHFASEENLETFRADPDKYLAEVDRKIIAQQKPTYPLATCVVSGEKLGGMGEPIDIVVGNRLVRLCCPACKSALKKDPAKYLAKIDAAVVEAQKATYPMDTCVVSGEKLGGMGEGVDYVLGTRLVRFCCKGCPRMFEKNPAKYLAKLDADQDNHEAAPDGEAHEQAGEEAHGDHHADDDGHAHHGHDH